MFNNNYIASFVIRSMPTDPVCGIEMDEDLATVYEYDDKRYYFCCEGCKSIFSRKPKKYLK